MAFDLTFHFFSPTALEESEDGIFPSDFVSAKRTEPNCLVYDKVMTPLQKLFWGDTSREKRI